MTEADMWKHLLIKGEFPEREKALKGLQLADVIKRPDNVKNSIYDELWHMTVWQNNIVLNDDEKNAGEEYSKWDNDITFNFPGSDPRSQEQLDKIIEEFLEGLDKAVSWSGLPGKLDIKDESGFTVRDSLYSLAVHNAYHIGKIISLRQKLGIWPPE